MSSAGMLLPVLYRSDLNGGWNLGMRAITRSLLTSAHTISGKVLEVGCGSGVFAAELQRSGEGASVVAVDVQSEAVAFAQDLEACLALAQADVQHLPMPAEMFTVAIALDVLDQSGVEPRVALAELHRVMARDGLLLVRVSAYAWLEGPHDIAFNTGRRYTRDELAAMLENHGFTIERTTYANALLTPPIVAIRLLQRWGAVVLAPALYAAPLANLGLRVALTVEARWLRRHNLPAGISLYAVARRR